MGAVRRASLLHPPLDVPRSFGAEAARGRPALCHCWRGPLDWGSSGLLRADSVRTPPSLRQTSSNAVPAGVRHLVKRAIVVKRRFFACLPHFILQQPDERNVTSPSGRSTQVLRGQLAGGRAYAMKAPMPSPHQPSILVQMSICGLFGAWPTALMGH